MSNDIEKRAKILIVDDEQLVRDVLCEIFISDYDCFTANSGEDALALLENEKFNLVISDIDLGKMNGIQIIPHIHNLSPDTVVVMISGKQTIESAIEAMRVGAFDYIKKPFDIEHVEMSVRRAVDHHHLLAAKRLYENHLEEEIRRRTAELNYLSYHDALTDLPNRILFEDRLFQAFVNAQHHRKNLAVLFLSLDRFKNIHDTFGHTHGFRVLQEVAERLKKAVGEGETVARFEGDEFALLLTQIGAMTDVIEIVQKVNYELNKPFIIDNREIFITASIGISLYPEDGKETQTLLRNAGSALSRAKEQGGSNYQFYISDMNQSALKRLELESNLRRALERNEFEVYYQPKVNINTRKIVGLEALIRWRHPELGLISPMEFIPSAEETGLILPIGEWILSTACRQLKAWQMEGLPSINLSVNISPVQFQLANLSETVINIVHEAGLNPKFLDLEVTESSVMRNPESAIESLKKLKEAGIKISIDDFGTGYSSLVYLKKLPIDVLKIDKSFVQDLATNPDDAALVMTIITLAHNLRLTVVAEGVETEEQLNLLHLLRCDEWQGYLFSKPLPSVELRNLLIKNL